MKKVSFLTLAAFVGLSASAMADPDQFTPVWERWIGGTGANEVVPVFQTGDLTRGGGYNLASTEAGGESVILVTRQGAPNVHVLSADGGTDLRTLDLTNVTAAGAVGQTDAPFFRLNVGKVAPDGKIYVSALQTAASEVFVYEWADDAGSTVPTRISDPAYTSTSRWGDAIDVIVSGNNRVIYVAANNAAATTVAITSTDGGDTWSTASAGPVRAAIGVTGDVQGGNIFMTSGNTGAVIEYDQAGAVVQEYDAASVPGLKEAQTGTLKHFEYSGAEHIFSHSYRYSSGSGSANSFTESQVITLDRTAGTGEINLIKPVPAAVAGSDANDNGNGSGAVTIWVDGDDLYAFVMSTNNYYGLYSYTPPTSVSDWDLMN
ncbi:MAG: hypothetical protein JJU11_06700 [Candidatus Sumerlaeia bacterium]|nr:hypothetical protein [Candidatus Sumerlaeia bacterium]